MIEQLNNTTTIRYNFPLSLKDRQIPQKFIELSLRSMEDIEGQSLQPYEPISNPPLSKKSEDRPINFRTQDSFAIKSIPITPLFEDTPVVAIDVSSMNIGETETGLLCAIRGAVVWKIKGQYNYLRIGPFPFHLTERNKNEIYNLFRRDYLGIEEKAVAPNLIVMQTRMGNLLEHWLQMNISFSSHESLILLDGSLTAGTADNSVRVMARLLKIARNQLNTILAFSKSTHLRFFGHKLTDLAQESQHPCLLQVRGFSLRSSSLLSLGSIYVAKLTPGICSFRVDIDKDIPPELGIKAVRKLVGNEVLLHGYPETLRLAHILSIFTANEVIAIQRFLVQQCKIKIIARPNMRRLLFGPFGKGTDA